MMSERAPRPVALITGTGAGIGRGIAVAFARAGYDLTLCDIDQRELDKTAEMVRDEGRLAHAVAFDLRDAAALKRFVAEAVSTLGRLDVLINNAGVMRLFPTAELPVDAVDEMLAVNLRSAILFSSCAVPHLRKAGGGSILHMGSVHAYNGHADAGVYAATKGALLALARSQAVELAHANIRVNTVSPGTVDSPMLHDFVARHAPDAKQAIASFAALHPRGRLASIAEVANCFVFLASPEAANITGTDLRCDGGYCIQGLQPKA